jgi:hypothetical protein
MHMDSPKQYPKALTLDQVVVERRTAGSNPNVGQVFSAVLKDGKRTSKIAVIYEILDAQGKHHHYTLKLETITFSKTAGWTVEDERQFSLDQTDEIGNLAIFLASSIGGELPARDGGYVILSSHDNTAQQFLSLIQGVASSEHVALLEAVLRHVSEGHVDPADLLTALRNSSGEALQHLGAAARLVEYTREFRELQRLVALPDTKEPALQNLLERNPWMFGSEYSELVPRRVWTRDDVQDFMLRRTVDGFLELIEIKRPFTDPLFRYDASREVHYASANLSAALGQAIRYVEEVERSRDSIVAKDDEDSVKLRARIFIGKDGDEAQQLALRNLNGHLHRVEVLTFDQLVRTAGRVLSVFDRVVDHSLDEEDDVPF